jgi:hypothetical protein
VFLPPFKKSKHGGSKNGTGKRQECDNSITMKDIHVCTINSFASALGIHDTALFMMKVTGDDAEVVVIIPSYNCFAGSIILLRRHTATTTRGIWMT